MEDSNADTSIHNTSRPSSYTLATDDISLQSVSKNHVSDSTHGQNVILYLLCDSEETNDPENRTEVEESLPVTSPAITGDGMGNNHLHINPTAPLMEIKPTPEGRPPAYNPYYTPWWKIATTPKPGRQTRPKVNEPPKKRETIDMTDVSSSSPSRCSWTCWLIFGMIPLAVIIFFVFYSMPGHGFYDNETSSDEAWRKRVLDEWAHGRVFRFGVDEDRRDVAILLGRPSDASTEEILQWIKDQHDTSLGAKMDLL